MKLLSVVVLLCSAVAVHAQPDLILYNGKIFTSNETALWAEAVAIKGDRISAIGKNDAVLKLKGTKTRVIDLRSHAVVPGFNDAHAHLGAPYPAREITLSSEPSQPTPWEIARDSISEVARQLPPGTWIKSTINPDLFDDKRANRLALDSIAPDHPVLLSAWTGHGKLLNSRAMSLTGLTQVSVSPGGWLEKNEHLELTGRADEYAGFIITPKLQGQLTPDVIIENLKNIHRFTASLGITTMQNMASSFHPEQAQRIYDLPHYACRTRLIAFPTPQNQQLNLEAWTPIFRAFNDMSYGSGVKLILDGTPIERLACMKHPYKDRPTHGRLNFSIETVKQFMRFALKHDQQILIHAVGDSTISTIIRAMRDMHPDAFWRDKRLRLEHAEMAVMRKEDLHTLKSLGIVIVQNPLHLALPNIMNQRLDNTQAKYLQAMRTLLDNGIPFAIGSDGPPNPFLGLMLATLHPDNPPEAITLEEAVIAYTKGSAYAEFAEQDKGTLEVNKLADLAVLSQDIFEIPIEALPTTQSILTILGGQIVHDGQVLK